ncbi:putative nucleic acid-binding protein [Helianthus anomalus]
MATTNSHAQSTSTPAKPALRKPVFIKVGDLKPETSGLTLIAKVLSSEIVLQKGLVASPSSNVRNVRIAECLVGDETGTILFTARNHQGGDVEFEFCKP